jgi:hypothetical protein
LSQGLLWPSMKTIHQEIKKVMIQVKVCERQRQRRATIAIPLLLKKKKKWS